MERQLVPNVALTVDYVGNIGRDQTGKIDINEGPLNASGSVTRLGVAVFDPTGTLIPAAARSVNFRRVLQYQTLDAFNSDYHALELGLVKRLSNRWSGRVSYTLSKAALEAANTMLAMRISFEKCARVMRNCSAAVSARLTRARNCAASVSSFAYQPRCLRAMRTP